MKNLIGENAGKVWDALNAGPQPLKTLKTAVKLTEKDLYAAIGWLAREEKIKFEKVDKDYTVSLA